MRTDFSANFLSKLGADGRKPIQYMVIKFPEELGGWQYISDRDYEYSPGQYCLPLVTSWGTQVDNIGSPVTIYDKAITSREHQITLLNTEYTSWWASSLNSGVQNVEVDLYQDFEGLSEPTLIDSYRIRTPLNYSSSSPTVNVTLATPLSLSNPIVGVKDGRGGYYPLVAGTMLVDAKLVPGEPIAKTINPTASGATILGTDRDLLDAGWTAPGYFEVEGQHYYYSGINKTEFTGVQGLYSVDSGSWILKYPTAGRYVFAVGEPLDTVYRHKTYIGGEEEIIIPGEFANTTHYIDTDGIYKVRYYGKGDGPRKTVNSYKDFSTYKAVSKDDILSQFLEPREGKQTYFEDSGSYRMLYASEGLWVFTMAGYLDSRFNFAEVSPLDAFNVSGTMTFKARIFGDVSSTNTANWYWTDLQLTIGGQYRSFTWTSLQAGGDGEPWYADIEVSVNIYDRDQLSNYNNEVAFRFNSNFALSEPLPIAGFKSWDVNYTYTANDEGYPKIKYFMDDGDIKVLVMQKSLQDLSIVDYTRPSDVVDKLLFKKGLSLEANSKSAAIPVHQAATYKFVGLIDGSSDLYSALNSVLLQCRSRLVVNAGNIYIRTNEFLDELPVARMIDDSKISIDGIDFTQPDVSSSINSVSVKYRTTLGSDKQLEFEKVDDESVAKYRERNKDIDGNLIYLESHAKSIADWILADNKEPPLLLNVTCYLDQLDIEVGDKIDVTTTYSGITIFRGIVSGVKRIFSTLNAVNRISILVRARKWIPTTLQSLDAKTSVLLSASMSAPVSISMAATSGVYLTAFISAAEPMYATSKTSVSLNTDLVGPTRATLSSTTGVALNASMSVSLGGFGYEPEGMGYFPWGL